MYITKQYTFFLFSNLIHKCFDKNEFLNPLKDTCAVCVKYALFQLHLTKPHKYFKLVMVKNFKNRMQQLKSLTNS